MHSLVWAVFGCVGQLGMLLAATAVAAQTPPSADGIWLGTLDTGRQTLRAQVRIEKAGTQCAFDSLDQNAMGIACSSVTVSGNAVSFEVPAVHGRWVGTLSGDGRTLTGTWSQGGGGIPLVMTRQTEAIEGRKPKVDAAIAPVDVAALQAVIDKDLADALSKGTLASYTHAGVTIGVVQHGVRRVWSYGIGKDNSVYEIGSITKTFTATILAAMVVDGKVTLDEPVRQLLPPGTVAKPGGAEIRLVDLSDQHSGLPRMPANFMPGDAQNPYADYGRAQMFAAIAAHGVALPADAPMLYSNFGVGLLGQALANRAGVAYEALLARDVTGPLGMKNTAITLTPQMQARFLQGYNGRFMPEHAWDLDAFAGAGAIRSDAGDMLTYLEAQLHPAQVADKTLAKAIALTHQIHAEAGSGMHIALNWFRIDATGSYWHNGGTGGFSSYALFNPEKDYGLVVLFNRTSGAELNADVLGMHLEQRLLGVDAVRIE